MISHLHKALACSLAVCGAAGCIGGIGLHYTPDPLLYRDPPLHAVTFWGHACFYIDVPGAGIVTDPVFEPVYASVHRRYIGSPPPEVFERARIVLISHAHNDHLSPTTLQRFSDSAVVLCPVPSVEYLDKLKLRVIPMQPGDTFPFEGGRIVAVTAYHPGSRYSYKERPDGMALGYVIETEGHTLYYTGDSRYFDGFRQVQLNFHPDLVLLNVNTHLKPPDALRAVRDLSPRLVIPGHFGAYRGSNERKTPAYRGELASDLGTLWRELAVGESLSLDSIP